MKVYLSGGFHSGWQSRVMLGVPEHVFFDPRDNPEDPATYILVDLMALKRADLVFAYAEASNRQPIGLAAELGYAKARNIPIVLVDETGHRFLRGLADVVVESLEEGMELLSIMQ